MTSGGDEFYRREPPVFLGWAPSCSCDADVVPCTVLDPFGGAGTTGMVARELGRSAVLVELNEAYAEMARTRCMGPKGMRELFEDECEAPLVPENDDEVPAAAE
jgi:hypothetical protein